MRNGRPVMSGAPCPFTVETRRRERTANRPGSQRLRATTQLGNLGDLPANHLLRTRGVRGPDWTANRTGSQRLRATTQLGNLGGSSCKPPAADAERPRPACVTAKSQRKADKNLALRG